jgi:hypothetical protein
MDNDLIISDIGLRTYRDIVIDFEHPDIIDIRTSASGLLAPSTLYYYQVTAFDHEDGESTASNQSFISTTGINKSIIVEWNNVFGSVKYRMYRSISPWIDSSWDFFDDIESPWLDDGLSTEHGTGERPPFYNNAFITKLSFNETSWIDVPNTTFMLSNIGATITNNVFVNGQVTAYDPISNGHLTTKFYVDVLAANIGVRGKIGSPTYPKTFSTDIQLDFNASRHVADNFYLVDDWIRTHLIDKPPAPTLQSVLTSPKGIYITWKNPDRIQAGFAEVELPYVEDIYIRWRKSDQFGNETAWLPSSDGQPTGSNTSHIEYIANSAMFNIENGGHINNLNGTLWNDYGRVEPNTSYDFEIWGINYNNNVGTTISPEFEFNRLDAMVNISSHYVGIPIAPSNVTVIGNVSVDTVNLLWEKPIDHDDLNLVDNCPLISQYMFQYNSINTTNAYGLRIDKHCGVNSTFTPTYNYVSNNAEEIAPYSNFSQYSISGLYPGHTYELSIAAKNSINSANGTNTISGYGPNSSIINFITAIPPAPEYFKSTDCSTISTVNRDILRNIYNTDVHYALNGSILIPSSDGNIYVFKHQLLNDINLKLEKTIVKRRTNADIAAYPVNVTTITGYGGHISTYNTTDADSKVILKGFSDNYSGIPVSNGGVTLYITDNSDHYAPTGPNGGFWKSVNVQIGSNNSSNVYIPSEEAYAMQVKYDILNNETIYSDKFIFYVDNICQVPNVSNYYIKDTLHDNPLEYIAGVPTYVEGDRLAVQLNVDNLSGYVLRSDKLHASLFLRTDNGLGVNVSEPIYIHQSDIGCDHYYYDINITDAWNTSLVKHNVDGLVLQSNLNNTSIQFNSFYFTLKGIDYVYDEDILACFQGHNIYGDSNKSYSDIKDIHNGLIPANHRIRIDNTSYIVKHTLINSTTSSGGLLVNSSRGIAPNIYGGEYLHNESIMNTDINSHLLLIDGLFRTQYDGVSYFKNFNSFYFPNDIIGPDYSNIGCDRRYATFKYTDLYFPNGTFTLEFRNSNLPITGGSIPLHNTSLEIKVVGTTYFDTGWLDANMGFDGVLDLFTGGKIVNANGSTPRRRFLYCKAGTDTRTQGCIYVRVGFDCLIPYKFEHIKLTPGFPDSASAPEADYSNVGIPSEPFNGGYFGTIGPNSIILEWSKPFDHDNNNNGTQITPFIERNFISMNTVNTTSTNGLNDDTRIEFTSIESVRNSGETAPSAAIARHTLINLMPGHTYKFTVAAKNTINEKDGINIYPGYSENSSIFEVTTDIPVPPNYFKTTDSSTINTSNFNYLTDGFYLNTYYNYDGTILLTPSSDGNTYVFLSTLIDDDHVITDFNYEKARTNAIASPVNTSIVSQLTGYAGKTSTYLFDPVSYIELRGFEGNEGLGGNYIDGPIVNTSVKLYIDNESDHYLVSSNNDGFWKSTNVRIGINGSEYNYIPVENSYSLKIDFNIVSALTISSDPFIFYVDDLVHQSNVSESFVNETYPNGGITYITGIPTYKETDEIQVQFNINNLSRKFIRGDKKHALLKLVGSNGSGDVLSTDKCIIQPDMLFGRNNYYYEPNVSNLWETSYDLHNINGTNLALDSNHTLQFNTFRVAFGNVSNILDENVVASFQGINVRGNGSVEYSDVKFANNGSERFNHYLRVDGYSLDTFDLVSNESSLCGLLVNSGIGIYPNTYGGTFNHVLSIEDTSINAHLPIINGYFRTPLSGGNYYKDYSQFYFPNTTGPDYSLITTSGRRYATFKYNNQYFMNGTITVEFQDSNLPTSGGLLPMDNMSLEMKIDGTDGFDTGWMDINSPHDGVDDYLDGGNMVLASGSNPAFRKCFVKAGTDIHGLGSLYIRVGLDNDTPYYFKYIKINPDFPPEYILNNIETFGIPNEPTNLHVYGDVTSTSTVLEWCKPNDHNSFLAGNQIFPNIQRNKIELMAINSSSANGLNIFNKLGPGNALYTNFETNKNSGEISSGSNIARYTITNLLPGHSYWAHISSKNTINDINGINSVAGYGINSSKIYFTTDIPVAPLYLQYTDCDLINTVNESIIRGTYDLNACHLNGSLLIPNSNGNAYVFNHLLLDDAHLITEITADRRRLHFNTSEIYALDINETYTLYTNASIIQGYGGHISSYDISELQMLGFEGNNGLSGNYGGVPIINNSVKLYVRDDGDYYTQTLSSDGFWKTANFSVGSNGAIYNYLPDIEYYMLGVKQKLLHNGTLYKSRPYIFYVDDLNVVPNVSEYFINETDTVNYTEYITGLPTYKNNDSIQVQFNVDKLANHFLRSDKQHIYLSINTANGTGVNVSQGTIISSDAFLNSSHNYYNVNASNLWNDSYVLHNTNGTILSIDYNNPIQINDYNVYFMDVNGVYNDNVVVSFQGFNLYGESSVVYSDRKYQGNGSVPSNNLLRIDGTSLYIKNLLMESNSGCGMLVNSGMDVLAPVLWGGEYNHNVSIVDTNINAHLILINGKFRSPDAGALYFKDYSTFYFPNVIGPDYSNILSDITRRYVTFCYTGCNYPNGKLTAELIDSNFAAGGGLLPLHDVTFEFKINGTDIFDTGWMSGNIPHTGVDNYTDGGKMVVSNGSSPKLRKLLCKNGTDLRVSGKLYIRIGFNSTSPYYFGYVKVSTGHPDPVTGQLPSAGIPNAPTNGQEYSVTAHTATIQWYKPSDHDDRELGDQSYPTISQNFVGYRAIGTTSVKGLNIDEHTTFENVSLTNYALYDNSAQIMIDNNTSEWTIDNLMAGHTYEMWIASRNLFNDINGTNILGGFGPNSSDFNITTAVPDKPIILSNIDCTTIDINNSELLKGTLHNDLIYLNGTLLMPNIDGKRYVFHEDLLSTDSLLTIESGNRTLSITHSHYVTDDISRITAYGGPIDTYMTTELNASIVLKGLEINGTFLGNYNEDPIINGRVILYVTDDDDHYGEHDDGFWKSASFNVGANASSYNYPADIIPYAFRLQQTFLENGTIIYTDPFIFHVDDLINVPEITEQFIRETGGILNGPVEYIFGIPTYKEGDALRVQFNINNLASHFIRSDGKHAHLSLVTQNGSGILASNNSTFITYFNIGGNNFYYDEPPFNPWETASSLHNYAGVLLEEGMATNVIQFNTYNIYIDEVSNLYDDNVVACFTGINALGNSTTIYSDVKEVNTGNIKERYLIRIDGKSIALKNLLSNSSSPCGKLVKSGTGVYPSIFGGDINHLEQITVNNTDCHLLMVNGAFRTSGVDDNASYFKNYNNFYFPSLSSLPDYSILLNNTDYRYATFKYTGLDLQLGKLTAVFMNTNLSNDGGILPIAYHTFEYKIACAGLFNTGWMSGNHPYLGTNNYYDGGKMVYGNGSTPRIRKLVCRTGTDLRVTGDLYIRIGFKSNTPYYFKYINVLEGHPETDPLLNTGIPITPTNGRQLSVTPYTSTIRWDKPIDHDDNELGGQSYPIISQNFIAYRSISTTSVNGLNIDDHTRYDNVALTAHETNFNSAQLVLGNSTSEWTVTNLMAGHTYNMWIASKNLFNNVNGTNIIVGYGPNSSIFTTTTGPPIQPPLLTNTDANIISVNNSSILRGTYHNELMYLNGTVLITNVDNNSYVFHTDLLINSSNQYFRTIKSGKRATAVNPSVILDIDTTKITGYAGLYASYLTNSSTACVILNGLDVNETITGNYNGDIVINNSVILYVSNDSDHYDEHDDGFWKSANFQVGANASIVHYPASLEPYALGLKQTFLENLQLSDIYTDPFVFYMDDLNNIPVITEQFIRNTNSTLNGPVEYIYGIPTYKEGDSLRVQYNINNLATRYIRTDGRHTHISLVTSNGSGELISNNSTFVTYYDIGVNNNYYDGEVNRWNTSSILHNTNGLELENNMPNNVIQFSTFNVYVDNVDDIYDDNIVACFTGINSYGNGSSVYSDVKDIGTGDVISQYLIRVDGKSLSLRERLSNSNNNGGMLVNSGLGIYPITYGGEIDHRRLVNDTTVNMHMLMINGSFRTPNSVGNASYFKDYINFYIPTITIFPDYSDLIGETDYRYVTFKYEGLYMPNGTFTADFINTNLSPDGGLLPLSDHTFEYKINGTSLFDTGWMSGNDPYVGTNNYTNGGKMVYSNGSSPKQRKLFCKGGTDLRITGALYIRVGFRSCTPYYFEYISVIPKHPVISIFETGIPNEPTNGREFSVTPYTGTIRWDKPSDHDVNETGDQLYPLIAQNFIAYRSVSTTSLNSLNIDNHMTVDKVALTSHETNYNSGQLILGNATSEWTIPNLMSGHKYEMWIASKNLFNSTNGQNIIGGYGPNSTIFCINTSVPYAPPLVENIDCSIMDINSSIIMSNDVMYMNGTVLITNTDGNHYVLHESLLNNSSLVTLQTDKRTTSANVSITMNYNVSIISAYGGSIDTYLTNDPVASIKLRGLEINDGINGNYDGTPVVNGGVILYLSNDSDHYSVSSNDDGFWKSAYFQIGANVSNNNYIAELVPYAFRLKQEFLGNGTSIYTDPFIFYVDDLENVPTVSEQLITGSNSTMEYVFGIPTFKEGDILNVQYNINNLGSHFIRTDGKHSYLSLRTGNGSGELISNNSTFVTYYDVGMNHTYYDVEENKWNTSMLLHNNNGLILEDSNQSNIIQFNSFNISINYQSSDDVYDDNIVACFTGINVLGNSSTVYSDIKDIGTGNTSICHLVRIDGNSLTLKKQLTNSSSICGMLVNSGKYSAPLIYGGDITHNESILVTNNNSHMLMINGSFRTPSSVGNESYFKNYNSFYVTPGINTFDYSVLLGENTYRYVTFKYMGINLPNGRIVAEFIDTNLSNSGGMLPLEDHTFEYKIDGTGIFDTGWMSGNEPFVGINNYDNGGKMVYANGSSPKYRKLFCKPGTDLTIMGCLYIRIGFRGNMPYYFKYLNIATTF